MNLTEFARLFNLSEMEKQAYILNKVRGTSTHLVSILSGYQYSNYCHSNDQSGHQRQRTHPKEVSNAGIMRGA